jgi:hypothetical protein
VLSVSLEDMEVLSLLTVLIHQKRIKNIVDLKNPKVLEILFDALNGQGFFHEGFFVNGVCPAAVPAFIPLLCVNLPNPSSISVAACAHENLGMKISELECLDAL